jgi:hypothetical protein
MRFVLAIALSTLLCGAQSPAPGMVNYIDGQASAGGQSVEPGMLLKTGQSLTTGPAAKVELLLTPGAFLRVGEKSRIAVNSASLATVDIQLAQGRAIVEVDQLEAQTNLRINLNGAVVRIQDAGLYDFDAAQNQIHVYDGKAEVAAYGMRITLAAGHALDLNNEDLLVATRFDGVPDLQDDLYDWSGLRSAYLAEANVSSADSAPLGAEDSWAWNPSYETYTYVPDAGIAYSPFGWGFYSPILAFQAPIGIAPGPIHRFRPDPGQWGPGHHYEVTRPRPLIPLPPGYRHALSSTGLQAGAANATLTTETVVSGSQARFTQPVQTFHSAPTPPLIHTPVAAAPRMATQPVASAPHSAGGPGGGSHSGSTAGSTHR